MADNNDRPRLDLQALTGLEGLVTKYVTEFDAAEQRIKRAERGVRDFLDPAINELRYAARHVIQAISPGTTSGYAETDEILEHGDLALASKETTAAKELRRATDHCLRARYDAIEIQAMYFLEAIATFLDDYRLVPLTGELQVTYIEATRLARAASEFTQNTTGVGDERPQRLAELEAHCSALKGALDRCEACRGALNNRVLELRNEERKEQEVRDRAALADRRSRQRLTLMVLAGIVGLCTLAWNVLGKSAPAPAPASAPIPAPTSGTE